MKKPKVLLVKSRSLITKVSGAVPPLGLLYVAAYLRLRSGGEIRVIDALFEPGEAGVARAVREFSPDVVGFSALTPESPLAHRMAAAVRAESPGVPVIFGGPYPSSDPELALSDPNVDAAVIGEGEGAFSDLVQLILGEGPGWKKPENLRKIPGLVFRSEAGVELSAPREPLADLDSLPMPAWDLVDYKRYWRVSGMSTMGRRPYLPIITSRGCPYRCAFCHRIFGKAFRARSPESVLAEAQLVRKLGASHLEFYDDIPNQDAERFGRMLNLLAARGPGLALSFCNGLRADLLEDSAFDLLKSAGTREVSVGVETASPRLQKLMGKHLSLERVSSAINRLADRRIFTRGFFMLGLPTESEEELLSTIRFAHSSRLHMAFFFMPVPYRNTELYGFFEESGVLPRGAEAADMEYHANPFNASEVPEERFRRLYRRAFLGFFLDPARIYRALRDGMFGWDTPLRGLQLLRNSISFGRLGRF